MPDFVLVAARHLDDAAGTARQHRFVLGPAAGHVRALVVGQVQYRAQRQGVGKRGCGREKAVAGHQHIGRAVAQNRQQFRRPQPPVQADHHHAGLGAAIEHLEIVRAVVGQHGHAGPGSQPQALAQVLREAAGALVELPVGHRAAALHVDQRDLVRRMQGILVQPVDYVHGLESPFVDVLVIALLIVLVAACRLLLGTSAL